MLVYFTTTLAQMSVSHNRNFPTVLEVRNPTSGCQQRSGAGEDSAQMPTTVKLREDSAWMPTTVKVWGRLRFDLQRVAFLPTFTRPTMRQEASLTESLPTGDNILRTPSSRPRIHPGISQCSVSSAITLMMKVLANKFFRT